MALSSTVTSAALSDAVFADNADALFDDAHEGGRRMGADRAPAAAPSAVPGGALGDDSAVDTVMGGDGQQTGMMAELRRSAAEAHMPEDASDAFYSRIAALAGSAAYGEIWPGKAGCKLLRTALVCCDP